MADSGHGKSRKPLASARPSGLDQVDAGWETCNRLSPPPLSRPPVASVPRPSSRPSAPVPKRVVSSLPPSPPSSGRSIAVPSPPRPSAAAATANLADIPEIEPDDVHALADEVDRSRVTAESLVPEPKLAPSMAAVAATEALLGQAPDLSLFAVPPQAVTGHASPPA